MNATEFRRIALSFPETSESAHMAHPDFRVGGKIFATLGYPDADYGMVVLPPEEQQKFMEAHPAVFSPAKGAWGRSGSTKVRLADVNTATLHKAMALAWRKRAPARLARSGSEKLAGPKG
jgi:hypothetical protein